MTIRTLTPSKVSTAKIRKKPYIIRDRKLKGFHLRVCPSGRKTFTVTIMRSGRRYNERIGNAATMTLIYTRKIAALTLTTKIVQTKTSPLMKTAFSVVADVVFSRYEQRWKPSTMEVNRYYLKNQLLPFFGDKDIASITHADIRIWFSGLRHITETANRAVPVLSAIMRGAEKLGLREEDSNPTLGLKSYKRGNPPQN